MNQKSRIPWIPLASFTLAVLIANLGGPAARALGRSAGSSTGCKHTFTKNIPGPACLDSETNRAADKPTACTDAPPPGGTKWYSQIEGPDAQGVYIVSAIASGAANDGTNLGPTSETLVDARKDLTGTMPCTPCHDITASAFGTATSTLRMGHPRLPFDFTVGSCISTVNVTRSSDCNGPNGAQSAIAYIIVMRFLGLSFGRVEEEIGFQITGAPGDLTVDDANPVTNNPDQYTCNAKAVLRAATGGIATNASVTFQGHAQVLVVRAPMTAGQDGTTSAMAAGRLGDLSLVDTTETIGD